MTARPWVSMVGAKQAFASLETGMHEVYIDCWVLEGELVSCTEALEFLAEGKRHCMAGTVLNGVDGSNVDAK